MIYDCCKKSTRVAVARGKQPWHVNESLSKQIMLLSMTDNSCSNVNISHVAWTVFVAIRMIATIIWKLAFASCLKVIFPTVKLPKPWCICPYIHSMKKPGNLLLALLRGGRWGEGGYYFKHVWPNIWVKNSNFSWGEGVKNLKRNLFGGNNEWGRNNNNKKITHPFSLYRNLYDVFFYLAVWVPCDNIPWFHW